MNIGSYHLSAPRALRYGSLKHWNTFMIKESPNRALKPENIMVDAEDRIKLIDFGIASNAGARRLTFPNLSQTMGTPDYISPEQVKGKRGDPRSDIYALGVMLNEMLTFYSKFMRRRFQSSCPVNPEDLLEI
jgi:serine/threonine protein kinase